MKCFPFRHCWHEQEWNKRHTIIENHNRFGNKKITKTLIECCKCEKVIPFDKIMKFTYIKPNYERLKIN